MNEFVLVFFVLMVAWLAWNVVRYWPDGGVGRQRRQIDAAFERLARTKALLDLEPSTARLIHESSSSARDFARRFNATASIVLAGASTFSSSARPGRRDSSPTSPGERAEAMVKRYPAVHKREFGKKPPSQDPGLKEGDS